MASTSAGSMGSGSDFPTSSGRDPMKGYEKCPYDPYHIIRSGYMMEHVGKCRHNYISKLASKGKHPLYFSCKYNFSHKVLAPELLYHEANCRDEDRPWSYLLDVDCVDKLKDTKFNLANYPFDPEEMKEMYKGLYLDTMIGEYNGGKPAPIEYIINPTEYMARKKKEAKEVKKKEAKEAKKNSAASSKSSNEHEGGNVGSYQHASEEDEEDWTKNCTYPPFDYMKNLYNPTRPLLIAKVPPGLNKSERKKFVEFNGQWLKNLRDLRRLREEAEAEAAAKQKETEAAAMRKEIRDAAKQKETKAAAKRKEKRSLSPIQED